MFKAAALCLSLVIGSFSYAQSTYIGVLKTRNAPNADTTGVGLFQLPSAGGALIADLASASISQAESNGWIPKLCSTSLQPVQIVGTIRSVPGSTKTNGKTNTFKVIDPQTMVASGQPLALTPPVQCQSVSGHAAYLKLKGMVHDFNGTDINGAPCSFQVDTQNEGSLLFQVRNSSNQVMSCDIDDEDDGLAENTDNAHDLFFNRAKSATSGDQGCLVEFLSQENLWGITDQFHPERGALGCIEH